MRKTYFDQIPVQEVLKRISEGACVPNRRTRVIRRRCRPKWRYLKSAAVGSLPYEALSVSKAAPKPRILSVSYDELLLRMRHMILQNESYAVVSTHGFDQSMQQCRKGGFDLFVLGHSIPNQDKRQMVETFRRKCAAPIISLTRGASEQRVDQADFHMEPDPETLLKLISEIVKKKRQRGSRV